LQTWANSNFLGQYAAILVYGADGSQMEHPEQGCYPGSDGWGMRMMASDDCCGMLNIFSVMLICMGTGASQLQLQQLQLQQVRDAAAASTAPHAAEEEGLVPATHAAEEQALVVRTEEEQELTADAGGEQAPPHRAERSAGADEGRDAASSLAEEGAAVAHP
jgi:hypothetical protein